jgi:nucleoside-diphosphate-sugar epimerase
MNIFLTGATGYVGSRVAERLQEKGYSVVALVRDDSAAKKLKGQGYQTVVGDLNEPDSFAEVVARSDGVIHTAFNHTGDFFESVATEKRAITSMLNALGKTGKPFVASNGSGVLGDTGSRVADESFPIPSDWPVAQRTEFEGLVRAATDVRGSVLRLPILVYGHGLSQLVPLLLTTAREKGVAYYIGAGENRLSAAHVDDIADLYVLAFEKAPIGSIYHVASGEVVRGHELAKAVQRNIGGKTELESISQEEAGKLWNPFLAILLSMNNQLSNAKAVRELGWQPQATSLLEDITQGSYQIH